MVTRVGAGVNQFRHGVAAPVLAGVVEGRDLQGVGIAPRRLGQLAEGVSAAADFVRRGTVGQPAVAPPSDALEDVRRLAAQNDGRVRLLDGLGHRAHRRTVEPIRCSIEIPSSLTLGWQR